MTHEQQQILTFSSEGMTPSTSIYTDPLDLDMSYLTSVDDGRNHSIIDFLQRPINIQNVEWTTNDNAGKTLMAVDLPLDPIINNSMYKAKCERFYGFRADVELKLQVNAQPFQAGRLLLVYIPGYKYLGEDRQKYYDDRDNIDDASLVPLTGSPRVDLDLSTCTEATMCVPYYSPYLFSDLTNGVGHIGRFKIVVYSPLVDVVSGGIVDCTLWINFKNIKIKYPTAMPIAATAQVGTEAIQDSAGAGVISSAAASVSSVLAPLQDVPLVSNYAKPALWVSNTIRDVAKHFGWSKPSTVEAPHLNKLTGSRFMANADGVDMSHSLGISAINELETNPALTRTDVDEMTIAHVARTPCFIKRFDWKATGKAGSVLYATPITPSVFSIAVNSTSVAPSHLAYISTPFTMWRGGINFHFKFVKTKFHSGRVRILFVPGDYSNEDALPDGSDPNASYSSVIDLRSDTDVTFNVPFVSVQPWKLTSADITAPLKDYQHSVGRLYVLILNELRATNTVSDTISCLVEVSGASDFELSMPRQPKIYPTLRASKPASTLNRVIRGIAQVNVAESTPVSPELIQKTGEVGESSMRQPIGTSFTSSALTVGEKVTSLRQILKRFHLIFSNTTTTTKNNNLYRINSYKAPKPIAAQATMVNIDLYSYYSYIYAYYRGSFRFKIAPFENKVYAARIRLIPENGVTEVTAGPVQEDNTVIDETRTAADVYMPRNLEGTFEFQVPHYSRYPLLPNTAGSIPVIGVQDLVQRNLVSVNILTEAETTKALFYRAVGDDFSFCGLLGPPFVTRCTNTLK